MDGRAMFDELQQKSITQTSCVVSAMNHMEIRGGPTFIYKYKGPKIEKDMMKWIDMNRDTRYPETKIDLIKVNGFKMGKHNNKVQACTDFIENTLNYMDVLPKNKISNQSTLSDIYKIATTNPNYEHVPLILKNKCIVNKHY